jgi:hypothetical protein
VRLILRLELLGELCDLRRCQRRSLPGQRRIKDGLEWHGLRIRRAMEGRPNHYVMQLAKRIQGCARRDRFLIMHGMVAELAAIPAPTFALNFATLIRADKSS